MKFAKLQPIVPLLLGQGPELACLPHYLDCKRPSLLNLGLNNTRRGSHTWSCREAKLLTLLHLTSMLFALNPCLRKRTCKVWLAPTENDSGRDELFF